jgi:hypothetical protein
MPDALQLSTTAKKVPRWPYHILLRSESLRILYSLSFRCNFNIWSVSLCYSANRDLLMSSSPTSHPTGLLTSSFNLLFPPKTDVWYHVWIEKYKTSHKSWGSDNPPPILQPQRPRPPKAPPSALETPSFAPFCIPVCFSVLKGPPLPEAHTVAHATCPHVPPILQATRPRSCRRLASHP